MEIKKNKDKNSISITNKSQENLTIVVEPIVYVEELSPKRTFRIVVTTELNVPLVNFFEVTYYKTQIVVMLNSDISNFGAYNICFFLDNECLYEQTL